jgi:hypothetical protein
VNKQIHRIVKQKKKNSNKAKGNYKKKKVPQRNKFLNYGEFDFWIFFILYKSRLNLIFYIQKAFFLI